MGGGIWPVGIGHPCYGCNEQGVGFSKGIFQLAKVENPTPRVNKPDVAIQEGGHMSPTATGLIGGALGVLVGVSLMTVRELGRQQKRHEAGQHTSREE